LTEASPSVAARDELNPMRALSIWQRSLVAALSGGAPVLSTRQMAVLLTVYLEEQPHTLRSLARRLGVSESATARAIDVLERLDFVRRRRDQEDRRNLLVQRTVKGAVHLHDFGELVVKTTLEMPATVRAEAIYSPLAGEGADVTS